MGPLTHLNLIGIEGPDALAFCQSLLTADLSTLEPKHWHPSAWCNAQGQVIVVMLVQVSESRVEWLVPASQAHATINAVSLYTIGRQVEIGQPQCVLGGWLAADSTSQADYPRLAYDSRRALCASNDLDKADPDFAAAWRLADLHAGLAWLCPELSARFLPQSLGLERLSGLSYQKGCYPGQEVIAKVHYRGQLKQHLVLLDLTPNVSERIAGTALYAEADAPASEGRKSFGVIIGQEGHRALAVARHTASTGDVLFADSVDGSQGRIKFGEIIDLPPVENPTPVS